MGNSMSDEYGSPPHDPTRFLKEARDRVQQEMSLLDTAAREARENYSKRQLLLDVRNELKKLATEEKTTQAVDRLRSLRGSIFDLAERIENVLKL
jgi:hypothetical protein